MTAQFGLRNKRLHLLLVPASIAVIVIYLAVRHHTADISVDVDSCYKWKSDAVVLVELTNRMGRAVSVDFDIELNSSTTTGKGPPISFVIGNNHHLSVRIAGGESRREQYSIPLPADVTHASAFVRNLSFRTTD
jgi:hypothetical protein